MLFWRAENLLRKRTGSVAGCGLRCHVAGFSAALTRSWTCLELRMTGRDLSQEISWWSVRTTAPMRCSLIVKVLEFRMTMTAVTGTVARTYRPSSPAVRVASYRAFWRWRCFLPATIIT